MKLKRKLTETWIRAGVAAALMLGGGVASAQTTTIRVSTLPIFDTSNFYAAIQEGYFAAEGLQVTTEANQQGGAIGIPGVVAGVYDVAYSNTPTILSALQQGLDIRIIGGSSAIGGEPPDPAGLVVRKADGLTSGKDLEGKSVAVNARNNVQWLFARAWIKATGGDPEKAVYREVPFPQMVDVLKGKQVDAVFAIDPFLTFAQRDPSLTILGWPFHTVMPNVQLSNYVTSAEMVARRPEVLAKFARAMRKGADWVNANTGKEPFLKLIQSYTKMEPRLISEMVVKPAQFDIDEESLRKLTDLMRENGMLSGALDLSGKVYRP